MEVHHVLTADSMIHSTFSEMSIPVTYLYSYYHVTSKIISLMINGTESMGIGAVLSVDITLQSFIDNRAVHWFKLTD